MPPPAERFELGQHGFTLIELVVIIVILGIIVAVAVPKFTDIADDSSVAATRQEMLILKRALVGSADAIAGGTFVFRGFEGDVGHLPSTLGDLADRPDSIPAYDKLTGIGWNGPYVNDNGDSGYLLDAWGASYVYQPSQRRILSVGGYDTISIVF